MEHIYLKLPDIKGESTVEEYADQIEINSFSYSCSQPTSPVRSNDGPTTGRAMHNLISLSKSMDLASTDICKQVWGGNTLADAVITFCRTDNNKDLPYLVITLEEVVVANYTISGGGGIPSESISLNFSTIKFDYKQQKKEGQEGGSTAAKHNLKTNRVE